MKHIFLNILTLIGSSLVFADEPSGRAMKQDVVAANASAADAYWKPITMCGNDFWFLGHLESFTKPGLADDPIVQNMGSFCYNESYEGFALTHARRNLPGPFMIGSLMARHPEENDLLKAKLATGDRFWGFFRPEWDYLWFLHRKSDPAKKYFGYKDGRKLPPELAAPPATEKEFAHQIALITREWKQIARGQLVLHTTFGEWSHIGFEEGALATMAETVPYGLWSFQRHWLFARSAARQYGRPWGSYAVTEYFADPKDRYAPVEVEHGGPTRGASLSIIERMMLIPAMWGANFLSIEKMEVPVGSDKHIYSYMWDRDHDGTWEWTELGQVVKRVCEFVRLTDRGTPYTPVAILLDHLNTHHYYAKSMGVLPPQEDYHVTKGVLSLLYPDSASSRYLEAFNNQLSHNPYGDIFDLIKTDSRGRVAPHVFKAFPVVYAVGKLAVDDKLAATLQAYAEEGGTLVLFAQQARQIDTGIVWKAKQRADSVCLDSGEVIEEPAFDYLTVELPPTAEVLETTGHGDPLVVEMRTGKGRIVVVMSEFGLNAANKPLNLHRRLLADLTGPLLPFKVTGNIESMFNKTEDGWLLTLVNSRGVYKNSSSPVEIRSSEASDVSIEFPEPPFAVSEIYRQRNLPALVKKEGKAVLKLTIPPGDIAVLKITG